MVFLGGPSQVGKATIATSFIHKYHDGHPAYLNWDHELSRRSLQKGDWAKEEPLIVLDEIHKKKVGKVL